MKSLTTKFALSVLSLVLTGVALSVGIYAWFTINNTASIELFNAQVRAGEGMYISLNKADWLTSVDSATIVSYLDSQVNATDLAAFRFDAITSTDGSTFSKVVYDAGTGFDDDGNAVANTDYLSFDLHFAVSNNVDGIRATSVDVTSVPTSWIPTGLTTPITRSVHDAARVSFVNGADATVFQSAASVSGDEVGFGAEFAAAGTANAYFISEYQLDSTAEAAFNDLYDAAVTATLTGIGATKQFAATLSQPEVIATTFLPDTSDYDIADIVGTIGSDLKIAVITVNIWIEGWDPQAFNAVLSGILSTELAFDAYIQD